MVAIATGVNKQLRIKAETTPGTFAGAAGSQLVRRVTSGLNLSKAKYNSNEIRDDFQVVTSRHGMRRVDGTLAGELSFGSYQTLFEASLRKAAAAVTNMTALSLTVALVSGNTYTITRAAGDYISSGARVGMIGRVTAGLAAGSLNKNFLITALTTTVATVYVLNGLTLVAEGPIASCTMTFPGKNIIVPSTGHIDRSFSIEELHNDLTPVISRLYLGCRVATLGVRLPATGLATCEFGFLGLNMTLSATEQFTSPTAAGTSAVANAVNGAVIVDGAAVGIITGINFNINGGHTLGEVIGSNVSPDVFEGRVVGDGQLTAYLSDATYLTAFTNESEIVVAVALLAGTGGADEFMSFLLPRVKVNGATIDDGEKGHVVTAPFDILKKPTTTGYDSTTLMVQDSLYT
jgi:hypothetical protein